MLGERLAEIRKNYHDTQKSLADKLGLTVWAVSYTHLTLPTNSRV